MFTTKGGGKATPRIAKWQFRLMDVQYELQYVPGKKNTVADCLSRFPSSYELICDDCITDDDVVVCHVEDCTQNGITESVCREAVLQD